LVVDPLFLHFPRLSIGGYRITSVATPRYNCIAWAAYRDYQFWWPDPNAFWPPGVPLEATLTAFETAFATLGYTRCNNDSLEFNFEKIVVYAKMGIPTHAARQLSNGRWTSKLGKDVDIEHASPDALSSNQYGSPVLMMRRPRGFLRAMWEWIKDWVA
jgi:hypothetical protein